LGETTKKTEGDYNGSSEEKKSRGELRTRGEEKKEMLTTSSDKGRTGQGGEKKN